MKKLLNLALCSAMVFCMSTVMAQNPNKENKLTSCEASNNVVFADTTVESVNINERTKQPQQAQVGGHFSLVKTQHAMVNNLMLIGEKNNDDNFKLQHYAKLDIHENSVLTVLENCTLKIQKDGKLNNRGTLKLQSGAELISPLINMETGFKKNRTGKKVLKHGINNEGGVIIVDKTSKIYWQETEGSTKTTATIHKGTVDFSSLFSKSEEQYLTSYFYMKLEGVKIKLFDTNITNITNDTLVKIEPFFNNTYLGNGCVLDGEFDFSSSNSSVLKLQKDFVQKNSNIKLLSKYTVVRKKGKDSKISEEALRKLFKNGGDKLKINAKSSTAEVINYSLKDLLEQFNKAPTSEGEETILNTEYMNKVSNSKRYIKELTRDWSETIEKGVLPLYSDQFTEQNGWKNYDIYFRFEGDRFISIELNNENNQVDVSEYQLSLYGDFSKYNKLLNSNLYKNNNNNIINNFVQMYSGLSPYLKTNRQTRYVVLSKNGAKLRLAQNDEENTPFKYAALNYLQIGTTDSKSSLEFDYSYNGSNVPNYAQTIAIGMMKMCNKNSKLVVKAGQHVIFGSTNISDLQVTENDEFEYEEDDENVVGTNEEDDENDNSNESDSNVTSSHHNNGNPGGGNPGGGNSGGENPGNGNPGGGNSGGGNSGGGNPCGGNSGCGKTGHCHGHKYNKCDLNNGKIALQSTKELSKTEVKKTVEKIVVNNEFDSESDVIENSKYSESRKEQPKIMTTKNTKTNVIELKQDPAQTPKNEVVDDSDDDD